MVLPKTTFKIKSMRIKLKMAIFFNVKDIKHTLT